MRKLFIVMLALAALAGVSVAQVQQGFDLTGAKYKYFDTGAVASVSANPAVACGLIIDNWLGMGASNYIVLFDSNSTTGISATATANKICAVDISSLTTHLNGVVIGDSPTKSVWFDVPIETNFGLAAVSNVIAGVKFTVIWRPRDANRYYGPY